MMRDFIKELDKMVEKAMKERLTVSSKKPIESHSVYENIDDYQLKTGKRFRMLKEQKDRGLSREEAFEELYGNG